MIKGSLVKGRCLKEGIYFEYFTEIFLTFSYFTEIFRISFLQMLYRNESSKQFAKTPIASNLVNPFVPNVPFLYPRGRERVHWEQMG